MPSMAFTTPIFHETHKPSVNFCGHLLYQTVLKFDKNKENTRKFHLHPYDCHWVHFYKTHTSSKFLSRNPKPNSHKTQQKIQSSVYIYYLINTAI